MNEDSITKYITTTFDDVHVVESDGTSFFFDGDDRMFPFVTLVTSDAHDTASNLNRPGVFRLNIGVGRETFLSHFNTKPARPGAAGVIDGDTDFAALDTLMPHPVYGSMYWVCILNPSDATFESVKPLLAEAYESSVKRGAKSGSTSG